VKFFEKYLPEKRRFRLFAFFYFSLFSILIGILVYRQVFQAEDFREKERKQGQRRIIRPGARGDVLDREGNLLIGNRAHYSASIHLELLAREIWEEKIRLRRVSRNLINELNQLPTLSLPKLLDTCWQEEHVKSRGVILTGTAKKGDKDQRERVAVFVNQERLPVTQSKTGKWQCLIEVWDHPSKSRISIQSSNPEINVSVSGLFSTDFLLNEDGFPLSVDGENSSGPWYLNLFQNKTEDGYSFSVNGYSHSWESRLRVIRRHLDRINKLIGRNEKISLKTIQSHWRKQLVLPLEISNDLTHREYAILIENLAPDSPVQVHATPIRHYPEGSLASHVLGYVGSGYQSDSEFLEGADLATFQLQGRTGKAGLERTFNDLLKGQDGYDIWIVNPMGSRFERIQSQPSKKGDTLQLTLDRDLQLVAEQSIERMVSTVAKRRILPDSNWEKTIERRTQKALVGTNETEVRAELLLGAFKDAPFPLSEKQSATVAGFKGTTADAKRLLRLLYAEGVLERSPNNFQRFQLAPPPPPPGAAVLIDLKSGQILSLASKPNYDLSSLTPYISQAAYDDIQRREAWLPRAWHPGYAPASPFKLVTAITGLKNGVIDPDEKHLCEGIYKGMKCHVHPGQHGELDLRDAISQSCNVYFFRAAEKITHQTLITEARWLKFDEKTPLSLPKLRDSPLVPDPEWKKKSMGVNWTLEDTFNISIGQGGLRQSPLQMACFASRLALNSIDFTPTLLSDKKAPSSKKKHLGMSEPDYNSIIEGMVLATTQGTARRCQLEGIPVAGKTGTGQWRNHNMKLNLAWFIGFAPAHDPQVAIAILVEGVIPQDQVQGGLTAAPIARDILSAYFAKYNNKYSNHLPTP